jgi:hypothetical protein
VPGFDLFLLAHGPAAKLQHVDQYPDAMHEAIQNLKPGFGGTDSGGSMGKKVAMFL